MKQISFRRGFLLLVTIASLLLMMLGGCSKEQPVSESQTSTTAQSSQTTESSANVSSDTSASSETTAAPSRSGSSAATTKGSTAATTKATTASSTAATTASDKLSVDVYNLANSQGKLAVWFFGMPSQDEHTGDCTLIRTPGGKTMLIDTGSSLGGKTVAGYLDKLGIKKIDALVITHMHQDHVGGGVGILRHVSVGAVYGTPFKEYNTSASKGFMNELRTKNLTYNVLKTGDVITLDTNIKLETLWPNKDYVVPSPNDNEGSVVNNSSVVLRMSYGSRSFLFTGDIEMEVEEQLVASLPDKLKCDVVKIPHHGAATSSSSAFVRALNAKYGTIMVYAMNDINIINRYKLLNVKVQLTSVDGTVMYLTDGKTIQYATQK